MPMRPNNLGNSKQGKCRLQLQQIRMGLFCMCMFVFNNRLLSLPFRSSSIWGMARYRLKCFLKEQLTPGICLKILNKRKKEKKRTITETAWIYRCSANSLKGQTALHCLANKGVRYPLFVFVLDMHTRSPGSQSYHIVMQLQPHRYLHVRQEIGSTFSQC